MRLSISSFDFEGAAHRAPQRAWGKIWAAVALLTLCAVASWEVLWRSQGVRPGLRRTEAFWAQEADRLEAGEGGGVVLLGSSRVMNGLDPEVMEPVIGAPVYNLSISGYDAYDTLRFVAEETGFKGVVVVELWPSRVFSAGYAKRRRENPAIAYYRERELIAPLETWLDREVDRRLVTLHPELGYIPMLSRVLESRFSALPMPFETISARRFGALDAAQSREEARSEGFEAAGEEELVAMIEAYRGPIERLRERGARVVLYHPPLSGEARQAEAQGMPRREGWERFLEQLKIEGLHYEDDEVLARAQSYDGHHLDAREAAKVSQAVASWLSLRYPGGR